MGSLNSIWRYFSTLSLSLALWLLLVLRHLTHQPTNQRTISKYRRSHIVWRENVTYFSLVHLLGARISFNTFHTQTFYRMILRKRNSYFVFVFSLDDSFYGLFTAVFFLKKRASDDNHTKNYEFQSPHATPFIFVALKWQRNKWHTKNQASKS